MPLPPENPCVSKSEDKDHSHGVVDDAERPVPLTAFEKRFRHPPGLFILFFTEMWERFSYYGMRGLLKLYMVNYLFITMRQVLQGGPYNGGGSAGSGDRLALPQKLLPTSRRTQLQECMVDKVKELTSGATPVAMEVATQIAQQTCAVGAKASVLYGWYTGLVYLTPFFGGLLADKLFGQRKTVVVGGILMAIGHFVMAFENWFFVALFLLILGNGAFKPNISTQVGNLYGPKDERRDGAFTIFYMGINLGAFICNFVCGTLAAVYGWHYGFAAAGVGMCLGLVIYLAGQRYLAPDAMMRKKAGAAGEAVEKPVEEKSRSPERVEARLVRPHRPLRAQHRVLGRLRAAGQHDADLGRHQDRVADHLRLHRSRRPGSSPSTPSSSSSSRPCST
jgi:POT family proton-dependent oligopeptide transporter